MKRIKPLPILVVCAAIAQGIMWSGLFGLIASGILGYIGGLAAGIAIVGIVTLSANSLPRVSSKRAREWGWSVLILIMVVEPIVLGIVNWWAMPQEFQALPVAPIVAGGASLVITLVLVLGALLDRSLVPVERLARPPGVAETLPQATSKKTKVTRKPVKDEQILAYFQAQPGASDTQAAEHFGISRQAIGQRRKKLYSVRIQEKEQI